MKTQIVNAIADYTGGNIYIYYGQLSDGNWFRATDGEEFIEICDSDTSVDDANYYEFYEEHSIETLIGNEYESFWNEMLQWIIHNAPEGNYQADDLERRMIPDELNEAKLEMKEALRKLREAWRDCDCIFGDYRIDCNDYILGCKENGDEYPFHRSFDEMNVVEWIDGCLERLEEE